MHNVMMFDIHDMTLTDLLTAPAKHDEHDEHDKHEYAAQAQDEHRTGTGQAQDRIATGFHENICFGKLGTYRNTGGLK